MAEKRFGFGIVGCGMIAAFHVKAIADIEGGELVAVYDRNPERAKAFAEQNGCAYHEDYDEFLANSEIDIVTICTPSGAHMEPAVAAAKAKKHIICEKPLEVTIEKIDAMIDACRENNVSLSGVFPRRFNEAVSLFKSAVDEGRFGKITMADAYVKWYRTQEYYDSGAWRGTWGLDGGGALMNQSIHTIDLLLYLMSEEVESVQAYADCLTHERIEVEDIATAIIRFKSGALGVIQGSTTCYSKLGHAAEVHICGSEGSVFLKDDKFSVWDFMNSKSEDEQILEDHGVKADSVGVGAADPSAIDYIGHLRNFQDAIQAIKKGEKPSVDGTEGRKSVELISAIYASALSGGQKITMPLDKTADLKAFK